MERRLWAALRARRLRGLKFRRQVPIAGYIVDFACYTLPLVVELDGGQHAHARSRDAVRDAALSEAGYTVLRFWNNEVAENLQGVCARIVSAAGQEPDDG
jgi:very-short-patch-repair endonuclease